MKKSLVSSLNLITENPELKSGSLLLALSGGIDSMTLAVLLKNMGISFAAAHCNFQLRAEDSDEDEKFVKLFCNENKIKLFVQRFDTNEYKKGRNLSTQMAARDLRYRWFHQLMDENNFDFLITAHHLDDSIETFLINLSRGTGIEGLSGIKRQNGKILRPLLNYSKQEIQQFAERNQIKWREDRTNAELDYARNKIRHQIVPVLKGLHPQFKENFQKTISQLASDSVLIQNHIKEIKESIFKNFEETIRIQIDDLKKLNPAETYFHYLFDDYGFHFSKEISKLIDSKHNGQIKSKTHRLIKNRNELILTVAETDVSDFEVDINQGTIIEKPLYLKVLKSNSRDLNASESIDFEKVHFPLKLRKPERADFFQPLGLKGSKLLSKFFKDEKYSMLEKEKAWILVDATGKVVCIIGKRIDERFKITEHTQLFLNIYLC